MKLFTTSEDGKYVYSLFLKWEGNQFMSKIVGLKEKSKVYLASAEENLDWRIKNSGLIIDLPLYLSNKKAYEPT
ncbi:MAG: alpha-L-fucosidase C-terminal domain-containing protein [Promethearchaeota archaeon]